MTAPRPDETDPNSWTAYDHRAEALRLENQAERVLERVDAKRVSYRMGVFLSDQYVARAQLHATLAVAAATEEQGAQ